ncbi:5'-nucleotidase C-terminal domain-containing protein [Nocardioides panacisoli]|uniref:bifunctional metallophosphatase/5'-nucleotidase n=1 Tax=Nocardioides panacisoli TaxID=627624 RepID=UPI001C634194|nr:5'-nucleotidase C-terminal domain-containing protein [Nocardioides panacisoli]QYJ03143.1 5'-nucleotidase C-terminal domain-containing protein [Nocardioides panacisoli]
MLRPSIRLLLAIVASVSLLLAGSAGVASADRGHGKGKQAHGQHVKHDKSKAHKKGKKSRKHGKRHSGRGDFTLTILHNNDGESSLLPGEVDGAEYGGIARFVTKVGAERREAGKRSYDRGESRRRGVVTLNSGDNFLAGLTREASNEAGVDYDARAVQLVGYDALGIGNHEFDFGPGVFADFAEAVQSGRKTLPLVSANLDFSTEPSTADLDQLVPSTIVKERGERIGVVGLTTDELDQVSSPGDIGIGDDLAGIAQAQVDRLERKGVDKIVLVSHLQGLQSELDLVGSLSGVDVVIGGGGDEILAEPGDDLVPGDEENIFGDYPQLAEDADGDTVPVVTTPGNYRYVGVLQVTFDRKGEVIDIDGDDSGIEVVDESSRPDREAVRTIEEPVAEARAELEAEVVASTEVVLDNARAVKRVREANLGNLIADAHLAGASEQASELGLSTPQVFFMNGGGIRGEDLDVPVGDISVADTFSLQPFGNFLSVAEDVPFQTIRDIVENGVDDGVGTEDGGFIQVSDGTEVLINLDGTVESLVLADGTVVVDGGATQSGTATIAQLNFSAGGGDGQPDLSEVPGVTVTQTPLGDQVSLRNFLEATGTVTAAEYPRAGEGRILFNNPGGPGQDPAN